MKIDTVTVSTPSALTVDIEVISKAERSEDGTMLIEVIATKRKINCAWSYLTNAALLALLTAVTPTFVSVEYEDPLTGTTRTGTFYTGSKSQGVQRFGSTGAVVGWVDTKFNFIEQ